MTQVAIVGAGISGLAAARRLGEHGIEAVLFDKSRGLGGRMATRRIGELQFDHGAQFFTAAGERFRARIAAWRQAGHAAAWFDEAYVGTPGMTAPARALAAGLRIIGDCQVSALAQDAGLWTLHGPHGAIEAPGNGRFAAAILAVPAPQAAPLAATASIDFPELARVRYAPCWALMLAFDAPLSLPDRQFGSDDPAIGWFARGGSKPGRPQGVETFVVHATPDWSRRNLERAREEIAAELTEHFLALAGTSTRPSLSVAHRWRYALVEASAGAPFLFDPQTGLGACGDWCIGPRVEAAFDSGEALADALAAALGAARPPAPAYAGRSRL